MEVRRSREEWSRLVDALRLSGEPVDAFASNVGVNARSLAWWRWRLGSASGPTPRKEPTVESMPAHPPTPGVFIELARPTEAPIRSEVGEPDAGVRVEFGSSCRVSFAATPSPTYLAALVRAYEGGP